MVEIQEGDVVIGNTYIIVCDDGVVRYLIAEECNNNTKLTEYVYYNVHGVEKYRTYSPDKIFKI